MSPLGRFAAGACACLIAACAPPLETNVVPIATPADGAASYQGDGLQVAIAPLTAEEQVAQFNVEMTRADVLPFRVVARNDSGDEYYIQADQVFGRTVNGDLFPAYRLDQTIERIRRSEVGEAMAGGAATGMIVGAVVGAAAGAAIGGAVGGGDSAGQGAAIGAATGGTSGGLSGAAGAADETSRRIARELRKIDWGDRVVYPAHIEHGFLFMKPGVPYQALEVLLYNVNKREYKRVDIVF